MGKPLDLTGQKFGMLTATECLGSFNGRRWWAVKCDCGNEEMVVASNLKSGNTQSCGCTNKTAKWKSHGATRLVTTKEGKKKQIRSKEHSAWDHLRHQRKEPIVPEWNDFQQFFKDIGWKPSANHYLSRHDARKPHGPTNTYWRNKDEDERLRNLTHQDLGDGFFIDMRAIARANYAAKERERATA